jgi:hypothetical protein
MQIGVEGIENLFMTTMLKKIIYIYIYKYDTCLKKKTFPFLFTRELGK